MNGGKAEKQTNTKTTRRQEIERGRKTWKKERKICWNFRREKSVYCYPDKKRKDKNRKREDKKTERERERERETEREKQQQTRKITEERKQFDYCLLP